MQSFVIRKPRRSFILATLACLFASSGFFLLKEALSRAPDDLEARQRRPSPHRLAIEQLMKGLSYSGIPMLNRSDVFVEINFAEKKWTLRNLHRFDENGDLILEQDNKPNGVRYGTCGELTTYLLEPVRRLFGESYKVEPVTAAQSGFFLAPQASHIVLRITELARTAGKTQETYVLDPSFKRYGPHEDFEDYHFFESMSALPFHKEQGRDVTIPVRCYVPLVMNGEYLLSLGVEDSGESFDQRNFVLALGLTKKHNYAGKYVYALHMQDGIVHTLENRPLGVRVLGLEAYLKLRARISVFFDRIVHQ